MSSAEDSVRHFIEGTKIDVGRANYEIAKNGSARDGHSFSDLPYTHE
jgi:hypothetical protein